MRIEHLTLYSHRLESERAFYTDVLGFRILKETNISFTVQVGWSKLTFKHSEEKHLYHYCFLIPRNQLNEALTWVQQRTTVLDIETGKKVAHFDTWNADSFYFYDASGNIAEMIVRNGLDMESEDAFNINNVLCINEIGTPTTDIPKTMAYLNEHTGINQWKGDLERFNTLGSEEGLFLLPNYTVKTTWFPTAETIVPEPYEAIVTINQSSYEIIYKPNLENQLSLVPKLTIHEL